MLTMILAFLAVVLSGFFATVQFGGQRMGGVPLAVGEVQQTFLTLPKGSIDSLYLTVTFAGISTAAAFNASVSTAPTAAAEGVDDLDLILNAIFARISLFWTAADFCGTLTPAQWRTVFGLLNQHDFGGTFVNAVSVPISSGSATTFRVVIPIPVSLSHYFEDGGIFRNGAERLKNGMISYQVSALTGTVVLANGSVTFSAPTVSITAETGAGSEADVGPLWKVERPVGLPTAYDLPAATRLAVLNNLTVPASTVTNWMAGDFTLWTPAEFGIKYQTERLMAGGYDITNRCTPLLWIEPNRKLLDFEAHLGRSVHLDAVSGVATITLYDLQVLEVKPSEVQRVSQSVGAGGQVTISRPGPSSLPPGTAIPQSLQMLTPMRILPGNVSGKGTRDVLTPNQVATKVATENVAGKASAFSRFFGRR